mgnify:CR=1 FL=1
MSVFKFGHKVEWKTKKDLGYRFLVDFDELSKIDNPPAIIYYKGAEFSEISENAIACVGTRKPTKLSYNAINYLVLILYWLACF